MTNQEITITLKPEEIEVLTYALRHYADEVWRDHQETERTIRKAARAREYGSDDSWNEAARLVLKALDDRNTLADRLAGKIEAMAEMAERQQH